MHPLNLPGVPVTDPAIHFLNTLISISKPVLWTPGTAQIGEGIENSWGELEDSEKEDEDEVGSDEAVILDDGIRMDSGVEGSNSRSQGW